MKAVVIGDPTPVVFPDESGSFRARLAVAVVVIGDLSVPQQTDIFVPALLPINFNPSKETEVHVERMYDAYGNPTIFEYAIIKG